LVAIEVKKEVDGIIHVVFELRKEVKETVSVEIEIKEKVEDPITFGIKLEVESKLQDLGIMQEKVNLNGIPKLVQEYTDKHSQYLYYHWVHQSTILQFSSHSRTNIGCRFPSFPSRRTLRYIPIACTSTTNVTLDWKDFGEWYELFVSCEEVETYAFNHYPNLTHFLISWSSYKKFWFVPLIKLDRTTPSV
jgi:hypothetical protein